MTHRTATRVLGLCTLLAISACTANPAPRAAGSPPPASSPAPAQPPPAAGGAALPGAARYSKVLIITEENKEYGRIIGSADAPYLNTLAAGYGTARNMGAGYAAACPSLPAYILLTSGITHGLCDDKDALAHPLTGDNVFQQVARSGQQWRGYAESMPTNCRKTNTSDGVYVVRHAPAPYFTTETSSGRCQQWDVPLGSTTAGRLHDDVAAGTLPQYAFVTPNACNDMHGAGMCEADLVGKGDDWLSHWIPRIMAGPDYRGGKLVIILTWDEGNATDNHIPALVISPTTLKVASNSRLTHCSLLRTVEEILALPLLNCAKQATSMRADFKL